MSELPPAPSQPPTAAVDPPAQRPSLIRRLYDWVIHWAFTPYALPALILISFAESSFFPIPPDVLLIPLCLGDPKRAYVFAAWCSVASVLGGIAGYGIGMFAWEGGVDRLCFDYVPGFTPQVFARVQDWYQTWDFWVVFAAGFSPIPYKVFTIAGGVFGINFVTFVLASLISRSARFFLVALLLKRYGAPVREFIERRFGLATLAFCVLLIGGFIAIKYVI
jgi:membrane protein YqaA with SNARE-associated domain